MHSAGVYHKLVSGPSHTHITNVAIDWPPAKFTKMSQWDCLVAPEITSYNLRQNYNTREQF